MSISKLRYQDFLPDSSEVPVDRMTALSVDASAADDFKNALIVCIAVAADDRADDVNSSGAFVTFIKAADVMVTVSRSAGVTAASV